MNVKEKISVIVPVYNVEKYLEGCLRSILNQTYSNLEIIVVDDGSTDNCPGICDLYQKEDERVVVIHKENGGLSEARNVGMRMASGDYFLFVDSDDMIHSKFCEIAIQMIKSYDAQIVSVDILKFDSYESIHEEYIKVETNDIKILRDKEVIKEYLAPNKERVIYHGLCMKMYKRELFDNLEFDKGRLHEDLFITYKLMDRCTLFVFVGVPLYFYYQNHSGICYNYGKKNFLDEYDALNRIERYFLNDSSIRSYVISFILYEYRYMIMQTYMNNNEDVVACVKKIRKWTLKNIGYVDISNMKKLLLLVGIFLPKIYAMIKSKCFVN